MSTQPLPPVTQRPQIVSRLDLSAPLSSAEAQGTQGSRADLEQRIGVGVQGPSTQVAQRAREAQQLRFPSFPTEAPLARFRGDVQGREVGGVSAGQSISRLPGQVRPFNPSAPSGAVSSMSPAEAAAVGFTRPSLPIFEEDEAVGALGGEVTGGEVTGGEATGGEATPALSGGEADPNAPKDPSGEPLSRADARQVEELKRRDAEVRAHEQAHLAAAGGHARGGMKLTYTTGPDGARYATDGEVGVDLSAERTPQATIIKMQAIRRAALAPASPSGADRAVASAASQREQEARAQLSAQLKEEQRLLADQVKGRGEVARGQEGGREASSVEVSEGAESFAGAQAVPVQPNAAPKAAPESRSFDIGGAAVLAAPSDIDRPVGASSSPRASTDSGAQRERSPSRGGRDGGRDASSGGTRDA
jgi:hypothetical protein